MPIVALPVAIPLLMAAILTGFSSLIPRRLADLLAILATMGVFLLCCSLVARSSEHPLVYWFGGWTPRSNVVLGISFYVDTISAGLASLTSLLTICAFLFSWHYFKKVKTHYHSLMLVFLGAMCGFCLTGDLFNLFVWFELMSATAIALCGYKSEELSSLQGAINFAITNTVGAFLGLLGIALLYSRAGALNMAQVGAYLSHGPVDFLVIVGFLFIAFGFLVKGAIVPFHFWLADAHAVAPTPVCILFSGVMVELGLYAVVRMYWSMFSTTFAPHLDSFRTLFLIMGILTAVLGAILCFLQRHLKRLLAFSTISHMGLMMIAFALLDTKALIGLWLYILGHAFVKSSLFICAGILLFRCGSVDEFDLHGAGRDIPLIGLLFAIGGLGLSGLPPFTNFFGESWIDEGAKALHLSWLSIVFIFSGSLTGGAVLRNFGRVFLGIGARQDEAEMLMGAVSTPGHEEKETEEGSRHIPITMVMPVILLLVLALGLGWFKGFTASLSSQSQLFQDSHAYFNQVISGTLPHAYPNLDEPKLTESTTRGLFGASIAVAIAAVSLYQASIAGAFRRASLAVLKYPVRALRSLHSGTIGDYIAWFVFGVASYAAYLCWAVTASS